MIVVLLTLLILSILILGVALRKGIALVVVKEKLARLLTAKNNKPSFRLLLSKSNKNVKKTSLMRQRVKLSPSRRTRPFPALHEKKTRKNQERAVCNCRMCTHPNSYFVVPTKFRKSTTFYTSKSTVFRDPRRNDKMRMREETKSVPGRIEKAYNYTFFSGTRKSPQQKPNQRKGQRSFKLIKSMYTRDRNKNANNQNMEITDESVGVAEGDRSCEEATEEDSARDSKTGVIEFANAMLINRKLKESEAPLFSSSETLLTSEVKKELLSSPQPSPTPTKPKLKRRKNSKGKKLRFKRRKQRLRRRRILYSSKFRKLSIIQEAREENEECSVDKSYISFRKAESTPDDRLIQETEL